MKIKAFIWFMAGLSAVGAVIDAIDGNVPKLVSSLAMVGAFVLFATTIGKPNQTRLQMVAYGLLIIAVLAFAYRLAGRYQWL